ncbi:MAG: sialic acid O-acetyltransferase [Bacteroidota bacterium]|nr:sialic acid O-acetyltransferase [Bacteroidota bacterium]
MTKIIVIGGIGTAVIIAEQIYDASTKYNVDYEFYGFAFDDESFGDSINGFPILCKTYEVMEKFGHDPDVKFIYSLYRPDLMKVRSELLKTFNIPEERMFTFIHPSALVARSVKYGVGNAILANVVVNSNSKLGNNNTFNVGTLIGHDTSLGNNNFFAAQVCVGSNIKIGNGNFIGLNSGIRNFLNIGDYNIVGMQSNVTKDITNHKVLYGNPAREKELGNAIR